MVFKKPRSSLKLTSKDEGSSKPLPLGESVSEDDDGGQHGEELPGGGDDGARKRPEVTDTHEDEILKVEELEVTLVDMK